MPELPDEVPLVVVPRIFAEHGVEHAWLVDPVLRMLEVFERQGLRWVLAGVHGGDASVRVAPFEAVTIELARWWMPVPTGAAEPARAWQR